MTPRKLTSLTLLIAFILLILTSVILYIEPEGRVAYWSDWHTLGLNKHQWGDIHITSGILFLLAGLLHLYYNWTGMINALKNKARQISAPSLIIALLINAVVIAGTLTGIQPFRAILTLNESFKTAAAQKYGEPPYGHAELSSLSLFAKRTGLQLETMQANLDKAGIKTTGPEQSILAISKANHMTPQAVFAAMQGGTAAVSAPQGLPLQPPAGLGRMTITEICSKYHLNQAQLIEQLAARNITATPQQTLREVASAHGMDPHALYEVIYETAQPQL